MKLKNFQSHDRAFVPIALSAAARFAIIIGSLISAIVGLCVLYRAAVVAPTQKTKKVGGDTDV